MSTGIRIETIKEINGKGEKGYRVISAKALSAQDLPFMYLKSSRPVVTWRTTNNQELLIKPEGNKTHTMYLGRSFYTAEEMQERLALIIKAGQHLADVKDYLYKERASWNGKVIFVDGKEVKNKWAKDVLSEKPEQLYKIIDGSRNLCLADTRMEHSPTLALADNKYRIISQDCDSPAHQYNHQPPSRTPKRNDTIVQNIDTGQIVFTCARFLYQI